MARKNVLTLEQRKKIKTPMDTAVAFNKLNVNYKIEVIKNLQNSIDTMKSPSGIDVRPQDVPALKQLLAWCNVNLLVGDEMCPPETLDQYKG